MLKTPGLYGIGIDCQDDDGGLVQKHADIAHSAAVPLEKCHLIKYKQAPGRFHASHYYLTYNSMGTYNQRLRPMMQSTLESFRVFALLNEFKLLPVSLFIACSSLLLTTVFIFYQVRQEASNNYSSPY
jgi:pre-mRNA-splicing helicase BRR2